MSLELCASLHCWLFLQLVVAKVKAWGLGVPPLFILKKYLEEGLSTGVLNANATVEQIRHVARKFLE